jgi:hypothetical protein
MSYIIDYLEAYEKIDKDNKKSENILKEYERIIKEKHINIENEINKHIEQINNLKSKNKSKDDLDDSDDSDDEDDDEIIILKKNINKLRSESSFPHGNGIFGFALVLLEAANNINEKWEHFIWIRTILGYKKVYPEYAVNYIEYKKDIEKSDKYMKKIIDKLRNDKKDTNEIFYDEWLDIIKSYISDNSIIMTEDIVFRPPYHRILCKDREDDVNYYRFTKEDIEFTQTDEEAEEENQIWLSLLKKDEDCSL